MATGPRSTPATSFDPVSEAGRLRIRILERPDGGREFVFPALRNLSAKLAFLLAWVVMAACLGGAVFLNNMFVGMLPGWIRFIFINHSFVFLGVLALVQLVLTLACLDLWFRSSRLAVIAGSLQVATHWLFVRRVVTVPAASIIEIRADGNTSVGTTVYYDLVVLTAGDKPGWLAAHFPAQPRAGSRFSENDLKSFNTGGKRIVAATGIKGREEADWLVAELRRLLKLDKSSPSPNISG